jgi:DNA-binding CsgD family transcriptional regulator
VSALAASELVGRNAEVKRVRAVASLAEGARALLIRGEPGMGKTSVWQVGTSVAADAGVRVLVARGVEAEMPLALAALADLLEQVVPEVADRLPASQRLALEAALGVEEAAADGDALVLPRAVLAALRLFADAGPVLVAVDDAQWVDRASARIIAFVLRRLGDHPVATIATLRGGFDAADPLRLTEAYGARLEQLDLAPLTAGALQRLLRIRRGLRLPRPTLARVQQASGGNPMFALEFATVAARSRPADPLTVPPSLEKLVRERVEQLPPRLRPLLELVAVLERPTLSLLSRGVGEERALALAETAAQLDVLIVDEHDVVRFTHPLLGATVYGSLTPRARRRLQERASEIVDELELRARHLALGCDFPDASVAAVVDEAAAAAARRGAPDGAAELVHHALRLTPEVETIVRSQRALRLGRYLAESSQTARAAVVLDELLAQDIRDPVRAEALVLRATVDDDAVRSVNLLREALPYCGDDRRLRLRVLLVLASQSAHFLGDLPAAETFTSEARAHSADLEDTVLEVTILKLTGMIALLRGTPEPDLLRTATELERHAPSPSGQGSARYALAQQLAWGGELEAGRALVEEELADLERRGNDFDRSWQLPMLVDIELRQGEWARARRHVAEVEELTDPDNAWSRANARAVKATLAVHTGALPDALTLTLESLAHAEQASMRVSTVRYRWLLGYLELSRGDPAAAWQWLDGLSSDLEAMGIREPAFIPLLPDAIETLAELGETTEAERLLGVLDTQAMRLEHRWAIPAARRSRALVFLARGETEAAIAEAERAAAEFEARGFPLDSARALLVAGQALRRRGERRRAGAALGAAAEIFTRLGADLWLERARQELARANPRPRRDGELTRAEHRVAGLVAAGRTNAEVAAQLYVTVGTVEAHLTRIYRKLDVRSRVELARRLAAEALYSEEEG